MAETIPGSEAPLGQHATRGAVWTAMSQAIRVITTMLTTVVVARVLSPSDYGVTAMVAPVVGFILIFQNLGLSQAIVQARSLDPEHSNALFWVNIAASLAIAIVLLAVSPFVGAFYGDPRAGYVTAATALTVIVSGAKLQHQALLNREMRFNTLSINDTVTALATFLGTVVSAFVLQSYWAIWLGALIGALSSTIMIWRASRWRPRLKANFAGTRGMIAFGASLTGFSLINFLARNADNVLIAKAWGARDVGLYDRSYKLMLFPLQNINQPLGRVLTPALSRLQDSPERYRRAYTVAIRAIALVSMPGVIAGAICSDKVIDLLLGHRWEAATPIFFWLSMTGIVQIISNTTGWLFISTGQGWRQLKWGIFSSIVTLISFAVGLPYGASGVARAYFVSQLATLPFLYAYAVKGTPMEARTLWTVQFPALISGVIVFLLAQSIVIPTSSIVYVGAIVSLCYVVTIGIQALTDDGRLALKEFVTLAKSSLPRARVRKER